MRFNQFTRLNEEAAKPQKTKTKLPAILVFKRTTTRIFPEGEEVSSYYSDAMKKTVIFPNTY